MKCALLALTAALALAPPLHADSDPGLVRGDYVEVRTGEVFTGPCMLGSEWESLGRDAIVAWKVTAGAVNSVALDGLAIVAVVVADRNLGSRDLGAPPPSIVRSVLLVDANASTAQRNALVAMVRRLAPDLTREVVSVKPVPIAFAREGSELRLSAGDARLDVTTTFEH